MTTIRIATTSLATLEDFAPPYNLSHPDPGANLARGLELTDAAGAMKADLVCLPETFKAAGLPASRIDELAELLDGPSIRALAERAKRHRIHVVAGLFARVNGEIHNIAVLLGPDGQLIGTYSKKHPTEGEIEGGVQPGSAAAIGAIVAGRAGVGPERMIESEAGRRILISSGVVIIPARAARETLEVNPEGCHRCLGYVLCTGDLRIRHSGDCVPFDGLIEEVGTLQPHIALLPANGRCADRLAAGLPGNFTLAEAIDISRRVGASSIVAHHHGMFGFNTLDPELIDSAASIT